MNDEEIKRLLENVEVKPSAHCWEAISSNIAAGTGAAATTAAKATGHALSTAGKIIIGAVGAAAIATTAVILSLPKSDTVIPTQQNIENQIVINDSTLSDEFVTEVTEVTTTPQTSETTVLSTATPPSAASADESPIAVTSTTPAPSAPSPKVAVTAAEPAPTPSPAPQATAATIPAKSPVTPTTPKPAPIPPATNEANPTSPLTDLTDPVLEDAETLNGIDFTPPVALTIPNIITPNGDGYNDVFIIQGIDQTDRNRLIIRNSSGAIVFQTVNYQNNWGAPNLAEGTYFYQFVYTLHGIDETRTGTLTIMR